MCIRDRRNALPQGNMVEEREEKDRVALHQPSGPRYKVLPSFPHDRGEPSARGHRCLLYTSRTAKEIAKMEGVSEYSVKESLKLARKKLEAFWKKFD